MKRIFEVITIAVLLTAFINIKTPMRATVGDCDDVKIIWANGSGANIDGTDNNYLDFKNAVDRELMTTTASYSFYELGTSAHGGYQYPAASVGINSLDELWRTVQAKFSAGEGYEYGDSAWQGAMEMRTYIKETLISCPNTKFVLGGLSQGGQVTSWAIQDIDPENIIYVATFGDPKLYLPEGEGGNKSQACIQKIYSDYRVYAPDCTTYEGILKARVPYKPNDGYRGKLGIWCNWHDAVCSSYINFLDIWEDSLMPHGSYGNSYNATNLYGDAAKVIRNKVSEYLISERRATGTKNVVIMIDATGSMSNMIGTYTSQAIKIANGIMSQGGKVALFSYRDLVDGEELSYEFHCGFTNNPNEVCTADIIASSLDKGNLVVDGGEDEEESLLTAMYRAMNDLSWDYGADKAMVVLTDAGYHEPEEYNGEILTLQTIVDLSKSIDPVVIYTVTPENIKDTYKNLTSMTGGRTFDYSSELEFSTNYIIDDIMAAVRTEMIEDLADYEEVSISDTQITPGEENNSVEVKYESNAYRVKVVLNDAEIGFADKDGFTLTDVDFSRENTLTLIPYPEVGYAGKSVSKVMQIRGGKIEEQELVPTIPKAPNSGIVMRKSNFSL